MLEVLAEVSGIRNEEWGEVRWLGGWLSGCLWMSRENEKGAVGRTLFGADGKHYNTGRIDVQTSKGYQYPTGMLSSSAAIRWNSMQHNG
mmetsp:Transcript_28985/g.68106  ORF Transcript_28985/g.68106 Transcript_28985/m.68106 type:complete len:89 (-) Transcript_28985:103-369(-)